MGQDQAKGKVGIREYVAVIMLTVGVKLSDDTPAILVEHLKNAYWMVPFVTGIILFIPTFLLVKVITAHQNKKNLYDLFIHLFGKYIGTSLSLFLCIGLFTEISTDSGIYVDIISTMYFTNTPPLIIYIVLISVSAYGAKKGIQHIGSVSWLVLFYIKATLILALLLALRNSTTSFLFPLLGPGGLDIVKQSYSHVSLFGEYLFIGLLAPFLTSSKAFKRGTFISYCVILIEMGISFIVYLCLFDYEPLQTLNYPYHELIRIISIGFLTNIETFFFPIWLLAAFIRFSFYFFIMALFFGAIFKIKNYEDLIPTFAALAIIIGMFPETPTFTIYQFKDSLLHAFSPFYLLLPCLMWIIAKIKGDFKNDKNIKSS
ncbi:GerAB/ArcD/ProY family transporter [Fredinandcohnia humi]